jgi:hypothetical protein
VICEICEIFKKRLALGRRIGAADARRSVLTTRRPRRAHGVDQTGERPVGGHQDRQTGDVSDEWQVKALEGRCTGWGRQEGPDILKPDRRRIDGQHQNTLKAKGRQGGRSGQDAADWPRIPHRVWDKRQTVIGVTDRNDVGGAGGFCEGRHPVDRPNAAPLKGGLIVSHTDRPSAGQNNRAQII